MSARKKEWSEVVGAIVVPSSEGGFMEVTHTPGQGGGPRGRLSSSHGLRPEPTRRGVHSPIRSHRSRSGRHPGHPLLPHPTASHQHERRSTRGDPQNPKVENGGFDVCDRLSGIPPKSHQSAGDRPERYPRPDGPRLIRAQVKGQIWTTGDHPK